MFFFSSINCVLAASDCASKWVLCANSFIEVVLWVLICCLIHIQGNGCEKLALVLRDNEIWTPKNSSQISNFGDTFNLWVVHAINLLFFSFKNHTSGTLMFLLNNRSYIVHHSGFCGHVHVGFIFEINFLELYEPFMPKAHNCLMKCLKVILYHGTWWLQVIYRVLEHDN